MKHFDNEIPEDLPSPEEMWAKLTSKQNTLTLEEFQKIIDEVMNEK